MRALGVVAEIGDAARDLRRGQPGREFGEDDAGDERQLQGARLGEVEPAQIGQLGVRAGEIVRDRR